MSFVATTAWIGGDHVRDLMVDAVEHRFGRVNRLPDAIEWLTDNGSCYIARSTQDFARSVGLEPKTTPLQSPQNNGMAEAFVTAQFRKLRSGASFYGLATDIGPVNP
jgi:putative transposase